MLNRITKRFHVNNFIDKAKIQTLLMSNGNNEDGKHTDDTKGAMFTKVWSEQKTCFTSLFCIIITVVLSMVKLKSEGFPDE